VIRPELSEKLPASIPSNAYESFSVCVLIVMLHVAISPVAAYSNDKRIWLAETTMLPRKNSSKVYPESYIGKTRSTINSLGRVNVPVESVIVHVSKNGYFLFWFSFSHSTFVIPPATIIRILGYFVTALRIALRRDMSFLPA